MFFSCLFSFFKDPGWSGPEMGWGHGALFFFLSGFLGGTFLGREVLRPPVPCTTLPAVPILAIWRQQAVDLKWSITSGDYPHLAPGVDIKALLRLMGGPFSASATHTHFLSTLLLTYIPTTRIHASLRTPRLFSSINHFVVNK